MKRQIRSNIKPRKMLLEGTSVAWAEAKCD